MPDSPVSTLPVAAISAVTSAIVTAVVNHWRRGSRLETRVAVLESQNDDIRSEIRDLKELSGKILDAVLKK